MQWKTDLDYVSILVACLLIMDHKSCANRLQEVDDGIGRDVVLDSLAKVELAVTDIGQRLGHLQDVLSTHTVQMANIMNVQRVIMRDEKKMYLKMKRCRRDMRTVLKSCTCEARTHLQTYYLYDSNKRELIDGQYKRELEFDPAPITLQGVLPNTGTITKDEYDVDIDLITGTVTGEHDRLSWLVHPSGNGLRCEMQGVLKITFDSPVDKISKSKLLIDMWFENPTDWVFNIGDSKSNDGWSGDGSTQENDCEFDGYDRRFTIHRSDKAPAPLFKILHSSGDFLHKRASFIISDEQVFWTNHNGEFDFVRDSSLFALNGQKDRQGPVNYDVFFSMNRVINGSYRHGHGLCRAAIRWL